MESVEDSNATTIMPYGLLISRILVDSVVDLYIFKPFEVSATYDTFTFSRMGYVLVGEKWHKKEFVKAQTESVKVTRISTDSVTQLFKDAKDIKAQLFVVENVIKVIQKDVEKILHIYKDTSTDVGKLLIDRDGLKKEWSPL